MTFLGAAAIREHGGLSAWSIVALAVLVLAFQAAVPALGVQAFSGLSLWR